MKKIARSQKVFVAKTINGVFIGLITVVLMASGAYINNVNNKTASVDPTVQAILDEYQATMSAAAVTAIDGME